MFMNSKKTVLIFIMISCLSVLAYADSITISQIDNSTLMINQQVKAYINAVDGNGQPIHGLDAGNFEVFESSKNWPEEEREIVSCEQGVNMTQGVNYMLIIDNSGSMYWDASGNIQDSDDESIWRITHAKNAVRSMLEQIKNPKDRVALTSFNVKLGTVVEPTDDKVAVEQSLEDIGRPSDEEAYTELYESLYHSIDYFTQIAGRKVIILLSDGENYPMEGNPNFPERKGIDGAIEYAKTENISVFTIGLSDRADSASLSRIAEETGGVYFPVYNPEDLSSLFTIIREQVLNEYLLTYIAGMAPAEQTTLRVVYTRGEQSAQAGRPYYSAPLFGLPQEKLIWFIFLAIPAALLLLLLLSLPKFENRRTQPALQILSSAGKKKRTVQPLTIADNETITIGGGAEADMTIPGDPALTVVDAQIENKGGAYTIAATSKPVTVNNQKVKAKKLRSGDVITVGETTIVFDEGAAGGKKKKGK
jgi:Ca-activated chloride channel family protein